MVIAVASIIVGGVAIGAQKSGTPGVIGPQGKNGATGPTGATGQTGDTGVQGAPNFVPGQIGTQLAPFAATYVNGLGIGWMNANGDPNSAPRRDVNPLAANNWTAVETTNKCKIQWYFSTTGPTTLFRILAQVNSLFNITSFFSSAKAGVLNIDQIVPVNPGDTIAVNIDHGLNTGPMAVFLELYNA